MSALNRLVAEYDRRRNSPRQLEVTAREMETKRICLDCRRVPDEAAMRFAWHKAHRGNQQPWPGLDNVCPFCSGKLVLVSW
jgi:hypothetical protein